MYYFTGFVDCNTNAMTMAFCLFVSMVVSIKLIVFDLNIEVVGNDFLANLVPTVWHDLMFSAQTLCPLRLGNCDGTSYR